MEKVTLAILNITSWVGISVDAEHLYGHLILCTQENVNIDNVDDWHVKYLGESIELSRDMSLKEAIAIDDKDTAHGMNERRWRRGEKDTIRFNTFDEVVKAGVDKWRELNLECPFISLYEGNKYKSNTYEPSATVILQYGEEIPK